MDCKQYQDLTIIEKVEFIGKLTIAATQSEMLFDDANKIIRKAEIMGVYKTTDVNLKHTEDVHTN